jgi:hypothetical protein
LAFEVGPSVSGSYSKDLGGSSLEFPPTIRSSDFHRSVRVRAGVRGRANRRVRANQSASTASDPGTYAHRTGKTVMTPCFIAVFVCSMGTRGLSGNRVHGFGCGFSVAGCADFGRVLCCSSVKDHSGYSPSSRRAPNQNPQQRCYTSHASGALVWLSTLKLDQSCPFSAGTKRSRHPVPGTTLAIHTTRAPALVERSKSQGTDSTVAATERQRENVTLLTLELHNPVGDKARE